jgi:hypothetical protein
MPRQTPLPQLTIRLRPEEMGALKTAATAQGRGVSTWASSMVRAGLGLPFDPGAAMREPVLAVAEELRRCGINLNQIARALNERRPLTDEEVLAGVVALSQAIEDTRGLYLGLLKASRENLRPKLVRSVGGTAA